MPINLRFLDTEEHVTASSTSFCPSPPRMRSLAGAAATQQQSQRLGEELVGALVNPLELGQIFVSASCVPRPQVDSRIMRLIIILIIQLHGSAEGHQHFSGFPSRTQRYLHRSLLKSGNVLYEF
eukprot:1147412-Pelagomonas_calceolata.AAC.4